MSILPPFQAQDIQIQPISCVEMHTAGEPTRIIWSGFPDLTGTLVKQRDQAKAKHDQFRRLLLLEPRGHYDMYGAILRPKTELVNAGKADMGVLFLTNAGFSMMCGHATIAMGRFLVDTDDESIFSRRRQLEYDTDSGTTRLNLHVPCGIVEVTVPTLPTGKSDPSRPVTFVSVPSFATALSLEVPLPETHRWPELQGRASVTADFSYGGTYYCLISTEELGFPKGLGEVELQKMDNATRLLKDAVIKNAALEYVFRHPETGDLGFLYSVMITDSRLGHVATAVDTPSFRAQRESKLEETGLCFFANQQVDRSPTGGCVAARIALAHAKGALNLGEKRLYNSLITRRYPALSGFLGSVFDTAEDKRSVRVQVEGYAFYTGYHSFVVEKEDGLGVDGFLLK
ncbi:Proline racemase [Penicillium taxi]|uniref:Proline racemase n=1 Tax=Penicillium taxi TaxID=168475 RepID=UPI002544E3DE|nr:Proline racemase [Penicillium taxi]KAJ5901567.1 Proline racemase [Penicillium taxi]